MVAEHLSFRAAAEELHLSATALSRRVSQLEDSLGSRLLERNTRRVELTAAGRTFLAHARTSLEQLEGAVTGLRDFTARQNGLVTVGCVPSAAHYFLPRVLLEFRVRYPQMLIRIMDESATDVLGRVVRGEADFGLTFLGAQEPGLDYRVVLRESYVLAVRRDHRFARRKEVTWAEVCDERFMTVTNTSGNRQLLDTALANVARRPVAFFEATRVSTLVGLVEAGLGVAAVPDLAVPTDPNAAVIGVPLIKPTVHRQIALIARSDRALRPPAKHLYDLIRAAAKDFKDAP